MGLRTLPPNLGALFAGGADAEAEAAVREVAKRCCTDLKQRAAQELPLLPFSRCACIGLPCHVLCLVEQVKCLHTAIHQQQGGRCAASSCILANDPNACYDIEDMIGHCKLHL